MSNNIQQSNQLAKKEKTQSERFMEKVVKEFGSGVGKPALTDFQKRLAQNYFISLDAVLKTSEERRMKKSEKYRDPLPVSWNNINMNKLATDVVTMARIGYDPAQPNHINMIPFKNNRTNQYDIGFVEGYRGLELKAQKYGLHVPDSVIVELVYSNDHFKPLKKNSHNPTEGYEFSVENPFDRGELQGGFYYHVFKDNPDKNKLVVMSIQEIEKRKPSHASVEFWGGEKPKWQNGQKVGTEKVEGWYDKMCWKTIFRAAHHDITIDSTKIDEDYLNMKRMEDEFDDVQVQQNINENANKDYIDVEFTESPEETPEPNREPAVVENPTQVSNDDELEQAAKDLDDQIEESGPPF
ncbi:recombinase family protein [Gracilibacillus alcaliphilus]|uniref:recombinase RecT n=1 Tax=Gracilibacillus alcaliphilus TaxID=1401441 RepID=UPI00195B058E|nr:recombinase RecT [Gracilibacillus alcaliphilus]MBM7678942.1 recombination protein RecT [Gracilibacillus alcaliphilus]